MRGAGETSALGRSLEHIPSGRRKLRNIVKRLVYPTLFRAQRRRARKENLSLGPAVVPSQRGTEYDLILSMVGSRRIKGSDVLLQGVGDGAERLLWEPHSPRSLTGIDLNVYKNRDGSLQVVTGNLVALPFHDGQFDVVASLNTYEHVQDVERAVAESARVLKREGVFVASFGPLFHSYGGDHFSSLRGGLEAGYNHLLFSPQEYAAFIERSALDEVDIVDGEPAAGLAYIHQDLFSHLTMDRYRAVFESRFDVQHWSAHIEPRALEFRRAFPEKWTRLLNAGFSETDLLVSTLVMIGVRRDGA